MICGAAEGGTLAVGSLDAVSLAPLAVDTVGAIACVALEPESDATNEADGDCGALDAEAAVEADGAVDTDEHDATEDTDDMEGAVGASGALDTGAAGVDPDGADCEVVLGDWVVDEGVVTVEPV